MAVPVEADFALIKIGDGATPEVFTVACGIDNVSINTVANTQDQFRRDCAKPGQVPLRKVKTTGRQQDVTGSGIIDKAQIATFQGALGFRRSYRIETYRANGTDTGVLMGHFAGTYVMTAANMTISQDSDSSAEVTLASDGEFTWTPAA